MTIPERYDGSGGTMLDACLFMEETSRGLAPIGGYATTLIVAGATQRFGTETQKEEILGDIASGSVEAIAMTGTEAGSDVGALACKADAVHHKGSEISRIRNTFAVIPDAPSVQPNTARASAGSFSSFSKSQ